MKNHWIKRSKINSPDFQGFAKNVEVHLQAIENKRMKEDTYSTTYAFTLLFGISGGRLSTDEARREMGWPTKEKNESDSDNP